MSYDWRILDKLPNAIFIKDEHGKFLYVNKLFEHSFSVTNAEIVGKRTVPHISLFRNCSLHTMQLSKEEPLTCEPFFHKKEDQLKWYQVTVSSEDFGFDAPCRLGIISEITKRIELTQALETKQKFEVAIRHITNKVLGLHDEKEITDVFAKGLFEEFDLEDCAVYQYNESTKKLYKTAGYLKTTDNDTGNIEELDLHEGIVGRVARLKKTENIPNTANDSDYLVDYKNNKSELAVPILYQDQLLGVLDSEHSEEGFFNKTFQETFESCASILAVKIQKARAIREIKEQRLYLNQVLESPKDLMFFSLDTDLRYTHFNSNHKKAMKTTWGTDIEAGHKVIDGITSIKDRKLAEQHFRRALKGEEFTVIQQYGNKLPEPRYWQDSFSPQFDIDGNIEGVSVFTRDITSIIEDKQILQEKDQLLRSLSENIPSAMFRIGMNGELIYNNTSFFKVFNCANGDLEKWDIKEVFLHEEDYLRWKSELERNKLVHGFQAILRKCDGGTFTGIINCTLWSGKQGDIVDGSIADITPLAAAKNELEDKNAELTKINKELDYIVYRTSHDMRAPVASMMGLMELFDGELENSQNQKYLEILNGQLFKLDGVLRDLVNYRKVSRIGLKKAVVDVKSKIDEALSDLAYLDGFKRIDFHHQHQLDSGAVCITDEFNLEIVLNNLLSNAIKYSDFEKEDLFVKIATHSHVDHTTIEIEDNGIGIDDEYKHKIFDMFFRATNQKTGTGLGLFILKEALTKLDGKIEMESQLKVGTKFSLTIPHLSDQQNSNSTLESSFVLN